MAMQEICARDWLDIRPGVLLYYRPAPLRDAASRQVLIDPRLPEGAVGIDVMVTWLERDFVNVVLCLSDFHSVFKNRTPNKVTDAALPMEASIFSKSLLLKLKPFDPEGQAQEPEAGGPARRTRIGLANFSINKFSLLIHRDPSRRLWLDDMAAFYQMWKEHGEDNSIDHRSMTIEEHEEAILKKHQEEAAAQASSNNLPKA